MDKNIHDTIQFIANNYDFEYAENSRESIRKNVIHPFRHTAIVEDNGKTTNSPNFKYKLTDEFLNLTRTYNTPQWDNCLNDYLSSHESLKQIYSSKIELTKKTCKN